MATTSIGIKLYKGDVMLSDLMEIPELGASSDAIEITTLADVAHVYTNGLLNYGDSLDFKFLYETAQFAELNASNDGAEWRVELPDGATCSFTGTYSVKLDGVGTGAALTYTLSIKPNTAMVWA